MDALRALNRSRANRRGLDTNSSDFLHQCGAFCLHILACGEARSISESPLDPLDDAVFDLRFTGDFYASSSSQSIGHKDGAKLKPAT